MNVALIHGQDMSKHTTFGVGGPAELFAEATHDRDLIDLLEYAKNMSLPFVVISGGSNILVSDSGLSGLVIKNSIKGISESTEGNEVFLNAKAGEVFDDVVLYAVKKKYWGLENLSNIPGSVGATPIQNVGAYGIEVADLIDNVVVYNTKTNKKDVLTNKKCKFGYRDSLFKKEDGKKYVVLEVCFRLSRLPSPLLAYKDLKERFKDSTPELKEIRDAVIDIRLKKFPDWRKVGTAGSFFKNPVLPNEQFETLRARYPLMPGFPVGGNKIKIPLGWILDKVCMFRGKREGNVGSYDGQALVVVNYGGATADDITAFAETMTEMVKEKTGIDIDWEVTRLP